MVPVGELMVARGGSVNPAQFQGEDFDLYSIPAFDAGAPEIAKGSAIGSTKQVIRPNDVLLSKIVPHIRRAWVVGADRGRRLIGSGEWIVFRSERAYPAYLKQVLVGDPFHEQFMQTVSGVGGSLLRARPAFVAGIQIPLPPLPEQRRIAAILDQAETLRTQRRVAIAQLDSLAQSLFLDMFGDPAKNTLSLPTAALGDLGDWHSGGTPPRGSQHFFDGDIPWFSSGELEAMYVSDSAEHISADAIRQTSAKLVPAGSLMLGMYDTAALKASLATRDGSCNQAIAFSKIRADRAHPVYVYFAIVIGREHFKRLQRGVRQKNLNLSMVREIRIPLPPVLLQQTFATRVQAIEALKTQHRAALAELDALFASLQHRAFSGELTAQPPNQPTPCSFAELGLLDADKGLEALVYAARRLPNQGHYWPLKAQYVADRRHLARHGRTLYGETHVAMPYGPVPQAAFNASRALAEGELICELPMDAVRAALRRDGDRLVALRDADPQVLGADERESLDWAIRLVADMSFEDLKNQTHDSAWEKTPPNAPMAWQDIVATLDPAAQQRLLSAFDSSNTASS